MLTLREIRQRIIDIKRLAEEADNEVAHGEEDRLYHAVLEGIAAGDFVEPVEAARLALRTKLITFDRWYA